MVYSLLLHCKLKFVFRCKYFENSVNGVMTLFATNINCNSVKIVKKFVFLNLKYVEYLKYR